MCNPDDSYNAMQISPNEGKGVYLSYGQLMGSSDGSDESCVMQMIVNVMKISPNEGKGVH